MKRKNYRSTNKRNRLLGKKAGAPNHKNSHHKVRRVNRQSLSNYYTYHHKKKFIIIKNTNLYRKHKDYDRWLIDTRECPLPPNHNGIVLYVYPKMEEKSNSINQKVLQSLRFIVFYDMNKKRLFQWTGSLFKEQKAMGKSEYVQKLFDKLGLQISAVDLRIEK